MRLQSVELQNIRQFVGTQKLLFATDPTKKITLIHGPNTTGKTTLLNAVHWCFYGTCLPSFDEPTRLKSQQSTCADFSVEVQFEHSGKKYIALRSGKEHQNSSELKVLEIPPTGNTKVHPSPSVLINSILPESLAEFFFFAGEYLKGLATGKYHQSATDAIRSVLGLKLAELALTDLKDIRKKKNKELQALSAGTDLGDIAEKLAGLEDLVESLTKQLITQRDLVSHLEKEKREIFSNLRGQESSAALQSKREKVEQNLKIARNALNVATQAKQQLVLDIGATVFFGKNVPEALSFLDEAITKKKIPSPFDKSFVHDILEDGKCICLRPVVPGSKEYGAIASLINSATDETMIRRALAIKGVAHSLSDISKNAPRILKNTLSQLTSAQIQVEALEQETARITDLLKRHEELHVRELEAQLDRVEVTLRDLTSKRQRAEEDISEKRAAIEELKKDLDRARAASPQIDAARTGCEIIEALILALETELSLVEGRGIKRITEVLNQMVASSTRQKYSAEVTREYTIKLYRDDQQQGRVEVHVLSSGERRLLDLCFVSSLVAVCREREGDSGAIVLPGAIAPMMVDAPFGELDPEYQALAAETMMELSDQLVLLLSKTHWTTEVDDAIRTAVGAEYLLVGHKKDEARDAKDVNITIDTKTYKQFYYSANFDRTEIMPVRELK